MYKGKYLHTPVKKMRFGSKRTTTVMLSLLLLLTVTIGATLAFLSAQTQEVKNIFTPSEVVCQLTEDRDGNVKRSFTLENAGDTEAYMRVKLISHWQNAQGQIIGGEAPISTFTPPADWVKRDDYYYYTGIVEPGAKNAVTMSLGEGIELQVVTAEKTLRDAAGNETVVTYIVQQQVIEVMAEAIQARDAMTNLDDPNYTPAVVEAWNVQVSSDGTLIIS